jgi:hypothetical protein
MSVLKFSARLGIVAAVILTGSLAAATLTLSGCDGTVSTASSTHVSGPDLQKRQQALVNSDHLIVPHTRVGPVRLGMGWDEVLATLGQPDWSYVNPGDTSKISTIMEYRSLNMDIRFDSSATPAVTSIVVRAYGPEGDRTSTNEAYWSTFSTPISTSFQTVEGIQLGSTSFDVSRKLGSYTSHGNVGMEFKELGLFFSITLDHRVWAIDIDR